VHRYQQAGADGEYLKDIYTFTHTTFFKYTNIQERKINKIHTQLVLIDGNLDMESTRQEALCHFHKSVKKDLIIQALVKMFGCRYWLSFKLCQLNI
jgi:hypothetical protein